MLQIKKGILKMENEKLELIVDSKVDSKELETTVLNEGKITETKIENSLNYEKLAPAEKEAINNFLKELDVTNTAQILQYGASAQKNISKFSDSVLSEVKTKDTGAIGNLLSDLVTEIKSFNDDTASVTHSQKGLLSVFNSAKKQFNRLLAKYNKVEGNIDNIEKSLEAQKLIMLKDIATFDTMYEKNLEYFKQLSLYIIAGEKKLEELNNVTLPALRKRAEETNDQLDVQAVKDMSDTINRFEKKLYDLKTTRVISIQMAPQIRLIQNNDSELINKIQSSLINTIPLWKNQIVIALGIANSKRALDTQKKVTDITNEMLKQNSEILKQGTTEIAQESERAVVDVETLQKTNNDLIETLDKLIAIHDAGREKRLVAEGELVKIESELKNKLLEVKINAKKEDNMLNSNN